MRKRVWRYGGKRHEGWTFTVIIDGKRLRRQGFGSRAEAQEALDELKHAEPGPPEAGGLHQSRRGLRAVLSGEGA